MRAAFVAVLVLAAGCAAPPAALPPATSDDGLTVLAYRVEPTVHAVHRAEAFAPTGCNTTDMCWALRGEFGESVWKVRAEDTAAVFWRVNATLAWNEPAAPGLSLDFYAVRRGVCVNANNSQEFACDKFRWVGGVAGPSPQVLVGEYFLEPGETSVSLEASAADTVDSLALPPQTDRGAVWTGQIVSYHPVGEPVDIS